MVYVRVNRPSRLYNGTRCVPIFEASCKSQDWEDTNSYLVELWPPSTALDCPFKFVG